ncbi:MAG: hypothetical protein EOM10_13930 [Opitutae bacterium]|nr:hypothetical protein [Opitutae bacterium]
MEAGRARLDPALLRQIEDQIGPLDWRTPQAHAIYWATAGLPFARSDFDDLSLRRVIYQALLQRIQMGERQWIPAATACVEEAVQRHPDIGALRQVLRQLRQSQ